MGRVEGDGLVAIKLVKPKKKKKIKETDTHCGQNNQDHTAVQRERGRRAQDSGS